MEKAKLTDMTERWVADKVNKTAKNNEIKAGRPNLNASEIKAKQTLYISKEAIKLLWHNRADTGDPISVAVEKLIFDHLDKNKVVKT